MWAEPPYFMTNEEWYYHDQKAWKYKLTKAGKAIPKVVESYNEFYAETTDENGDIVEV